ncbi:MAG: DNA repair protein RecO [Rhizobiaceae bacterium]
MEWKDDGVILSARRHGESSAILEVMTRDHGRHMGLVRGARSARMSPVLQPGNSVSLVWRARLEEHLGNFIVEADVLRAARLMETGLGLYGLQTLAAHLRLLPERDPHRAMYDAALVLVENLDEFEKAARLMIRFEIALLEELGFGLDLSRCAATGSRENLIYVSPKTGKAVSAEAGRPWAPKLLPLPSYLAPDSRSAPFSLDAVRDGFALTAHFLARDVWTPRGFMPPDERAGFIRHVMKGQTDY